MVDSKGRSSIPVRHKRVIFVGGYGSGKTEVSVNFARHLHETNRTPVALVDLDLVNPYFRSREARAVLEKEGIRVVSPQGDQHYGELPIVLPEVAGLLQAPGGYLVLDVGGDDVGVTALASLSDQIPRGEYEFWVVLNANRPFTSTPDTAKKIIREIETASRLTTTGIVANTHLLGGTTQVDVNKGIELAQQVSRDLGLDDPWVALEKNLAKEIDWKSVGLAHLPLELTMLRPWERSSGGEK